MLSVLTIHLLVLKTRKLFLICNDDHGNISRGMSIFKYLLSDTFCKISGFSCIRPNNSSISCFIIFKQSFLIL